MRNVLQERYYSLNNTRANNKYLVQIRSQTKSSRVSLPEVHGIGKGLDPHVRPEKQKPITSSTAIRLPVYKARIEQGRAGVRKKVRTVLPSQPKETSAPATVQKSIPEVSAQPQVTAQTEHVSLAQNDFRLPLSPRIVTRKVPIFLIHF